MSTPVNPPAPKRRYDGSRRRQAAGQTRGRIVEAARQAFLARGYIGTTVVEIAEAAGVAVDTVYATMGSKPELLRMLIEQSISGTRSDVPADERAYVLAMRAERDPVRKLAIYASAIREMQARLAPLFLVLRDAARAEPALAGLWAEISERRARNMRRLIADVASVTELRAGLSTDEAADLIWATNSPEFYVLLVHERGWSAERFEARLLDLWVRALLPD